VDGGFVDGGLVEGAVLVAAGALEHPLIKIAHANAATAWCTNRLPGPITQMLDGPRWVEAQATWPGPFDLTERGKV